MSKSPTPDAVSPDVNPNITSEQTLTDDGLDAQQRLEVKNITNVSPDQSSSSASVSVNGQTYTVNGNGQLNKSIKTDSTNTNLNISVQNGNNGSSNSSSTVHVESSTTKGGL